jgi:aminoglycoside 3-N-acetyltransferase
VRSLHPTHSVVAIGKLARWLAQGHELVRTPCGSGSPYGKLADIAGKIALVGVSQAANTSFHHSEEVAGTPYVLLPEPVDLSLIDSDGREVTMRGTYVHRWGPKRDYELFELAMIDYGICRLGKVGDAEVRVVDAMLMRMLLVRKLLDDSLATLALGEREQWIGRVRSGN